MDITWRGGSCFQIQSSERSLFVGDTTGVDVKNELVLTSNEEAAKGASRIFSWPGEYEMSDVPINAFEQDGVMIFSFQFEGVRFCHLGRLKEQLVDDLVNKIGDIDVLFIDLGSDSGMKKDDSVSVIESVEPRVIIAMGEGELTSVAKSLGANVEDDLKKFTIKSSGSLPSDKMDYVVLSKQ